MNDITASTLRTSVLPEAAFPFFNPATEELEHILGKYFNAGSGNGSSLPASGGLFFDGVTNTVPVKHLLTGSNVASRVFGFHFTILVPAKSQIKAGGRGIGGISLGDPASSINSSITVGIRGTSGYGNAGVSVAGDLVLKVINSSGSDLDLYAPGFCDAFAGQIVRIDFTRGLTSFDFPAKLYVNGVKVAEASGSGNDWGIPLGNDPYFFYGCQSSARPWIGKILRAGISAVDYSADDLLAFTEPLPNQLESVVLGTILTNRDSDCNAYAGFTWNDWTGDGVAYTESQGGTVTPSAGSVTAWAHGEVNGTASPGKLRLTARASSGKNWAVKSGAVKGRAYRLTVKATCVSGTPAPIYFGFGYNVGNTSQEQNAGESLIFTPTGTEGTYSARVVARTAGSIYLGLLNDADSAGQVYTFDDILVERDGWAVWADFGIGDGFVVPNISASASDGVIPGSSGIVWASPKRNVPLSVRLAADQVLSSANTGTTLQDTGLSFRIAANAKYAYRFAVPFTLAGTASGFKFNLVAPAGATGATTAVIFNTVSNNLNEAQATANYPVLVQGSLTSAATHLLQLTGVIENGATEGLVTLQAAQFVSDAGAITVLKNSSVEFSRRQ